MRGRRSYYRVYTWDEPENGGYLPRPRRRLPAGILVVVAAILMLGLALILRTRFTLSASPLALVPSRTEPGATSAPRGGASPGANTVTPPTDEEQGLVAPAASPLPTPVAGNRLLLPAGLAPEPLVLTYWEQESDAGAALLDGLAAGFMRANPNILVRRVHFASSEELRNEFSSLVAQGGGPELVRGPNDLTSSFSQAGAIRPIDDLYDQAALADFFPGSLWGATIARTLWALPDNYGGHLMLLYNRQLVQEVPADTRAWLVQLKALTDAPSGQYGLAYNFNEPYWLVPWIGGYGGWPLNEDDRADLNNEALIDALAFARDLKQVHRVLAPAATYDTAAALFKAGKAAYLIDGPWSLDDYRQAGIDLGLAPLPRVAEMGRDPIPMTGGKYWYFSRNATGPRLEAARRLVAYMTAAPAQLEWMTRLSRLPSSRAAAQAKAVAKDPSLAAEILALSKGRAIPPGPVLYCVLDAMRSPLEAVMAATQEAAEAARQMQADADRCIAAGAPSPAVPQ